MLKTRIVINLEKIKILFVCDFNSIHSRNLISGLCADETLSISVLSTYDAPTMKDVNLTLLSKGSLSDKKSLGYIANLILTISTSLYRRAVAFVLSRRTQELIQKAHQISLDEKPDIIHALRTQPEGIIANALLEKYDVPLALTTWGQDFVLWPKYNLWIKNKSEETVKNASFIFPDNIRDDRIVKEISNNSAKETLVLPATGGLDLKYLNGLSLRQIPAIMGNLNFLHTRGYANTYINLNELLNTFKRIKVDYSEAHFYIDLHSNIYKEKDEELMTWIKKNKLEDSVTLLHLNREGMFSYMSKCRYHVSATYSDGLPLSLLEALYFGQVPIVFNHESTRVLENEFDYYYSFNSFNSSEIEKTWRKVIETQIPNQGELKVKNQAVILENYDRISNLIKIKEKYEYILNKPS